jgi:tRNA pseudouridine55 synthase
MTSARRHGGKRLYELAHEGKSVQREPQEIIIHSLELLDFGTGAEDRFPYGLLDVVCSSGTYVRTLCVDIGREVDSPAYMSYLLRCGVGPFHVNEAYTLEELEQLKPLGDSTPVIPLGQILQWFPTLKLDRKQAEGVIHGLPPEKVDRSAQLMCSRVSAGFIVSKSDCEAVEEVVRLVGPDDEFLAVGVLLQSNLYWTVDLKKVFP